MTGPENYRQAGFHLKAGAAIETDGHDDSASAWHQRQAQVHATLALAAATALRGTGDRGLPPVDFAEWYRVAAVKPGDEGDLDQADAYAGLGRQLAQEDGQ
jgi:hypothetical protein